MGTPTYITPRYVFKFVLKARGLYPFPLFDRFEDDGWDESKVKVNYVFGKPPFGRAAK